MADDSVVDTNFAGSVSQSDCDSNRQRITISREWQDVPQFEVDHSPVPKGQSLEDKLKAVLPPEPVRSALKPPTTTHEWLEFLFVHVPILHWVWTYQSRFFIGDIIGGVTVAVVHIPQGLAYALLALLDPVYGLYASFVPVIIYSFLGSSKHVSVGTFAVVQLMIAGAIERVLSSDPSLSHCLESNTENNDNATLESASGNASLVEVDCGAVKADIAVTIALLSGVIMLLMGIMQLGFITIFLSEVLISGYTTGAACHVFTSQLGHILGIDNSVSPGVFQLPKIWIKSFTRLGQTNPATVIISIVAIAILIAFVIVNMLLKGVHIPVWYYSPEKHKWQKTKVKWTLPLPSQLFVVILFTLISYLGKLEKKYDVIIVGDIPPGAPPVSVPSGDYFLSVFQDSFAIAIVTYTITISLARVLAKRFDYDVHSNQEFIACGAMNIFGSFFSSFTAAGNLSRSMVQADAGGHTQLVGLVSSGVILVVLLWLGSLFEPLPRAVLAAIVWVALYRLFLQVKDAWKYYKMSWGDLLVWLVVFFSTVLLGVDIGLGVGVFFSLLVLNIRTILPYSAILGQATNTEIFKNKDRFQVETVPGVVVFRFMAPLCFINTLVFCKRLEIACGLEKRRKPVADEPGCLQKLAAMSRKSTRSKSEQNGRWTFEGSMNQSINQSSITRSPSFMLALQQDIVVEVLDSHVSPDLAPIVHTIIIDCSSIVFLDSAGVKALCQIVLEFHKNHNIQFKTKYYLIPEENEDMLERGHFFEVCGRKRLFPSLQDAVHHGQYGCRLHPTVNGQKTP